MNEMQLKCISLIIFEVFSKFEWFNFLFVEDTMRHDADFGGLRHKGPKLTPTPPPPHPTLKSQSFLSENVEWGLVRWFQTMMVLLCCNDHRI